MSLNSAVSSVETHIKNAYNAVAEMGGESPANKNLANLAAAVDSITTGPAVPTSLAQLKQMVDAGREIIIGTEIPDTYAGNSNPLIVAQNLNSANNADYGGAEGVILVRKFVDPISQEFGNTPSYNISTIKNFLDTTYLDNCSDALGSVISDINVPYNTTTVKGKLFLMSDTEVCAAGFDGYVEGIMWDYWKQKTGLSSPNNGSNSGRIVTDRNGNTVNISVWLRSRRNYSGTDICHIVSTGAISYNGFRNTAGVLPACFVAKESK